MEYDIPGALNGTPPGLVTSIICYPGSLESRPPDLLQV
jgi:hypothetical protein